MEHIDIFLLFPETEDDIIALGEDPQEYKLIIQKLSKLKNLLKNFDYSLFYDRGNLKNFVEKAKVICDEKYLHAPLLQLRTFLQRRTTDVSVNPLIESNGVVYHKWNLGVCSAENITTIIQSSAEKFLNSSATSEVVIVSFLKEDGHRRDIMPVIKDAVHIKGLPKLCCIPYFNPVNTFIEWYRVQINNRPFSLQDPVRFERTCYLSPGSQERVYKERETSHYWYYDFFHKDNKEHYEVFDECGKHLGEADMCGKLDSTKKDSRKLLNLD